MMTISNLLASMRPRGRIMCRGLAGAFALVVSGTIAAGQSPSVLVQSTTSTANSGLYDAILPAFKAETGITVNVVAVGTGQAIENARNCDADVLLVHATAAEEAFVAEGGGLSRHDLMYNDFVIVGPADDPADINGINDAQTAMTQIATVGALFASRGDDSGTHKKELALWADTGIDPTAPRADWYRETGSGMGATLNVGIGLKAYVMTDRATWISFGNKQDYGIAVQGDPDLANQYGVILVNQGVCPNVDATSGQAFIDWLLSPVGQDAIDAYQMDGQQLFFANATPKEK